MTSWHPHYAAALRGIAERLRLEPVARIARQPGMQAVYRLTLLYAGFRACAAVGTLRQTLLSGAVLTLQFDGALHALPLSYSLPERRCEAFVRLLRTARFDHLADQPDLPGFDTADVWWVERGANTFTHDVILAPGSAQGEHGQIVAAVRACLPEVLREIPP
jgi:hypothetical protein